MKKQEEVDGADTPKDQSTQCPSPIIIILLINLILSCYSTSK